MSLDTTQPEVNLFAGTLNMPTIDDRPQQTIAQAPKAATGIGSLNPVQQANNFAGLFPEDTLGQAIANRGTRIG